MRGSHHPPKNCSTTRCREGLILLYFDLLKFWIDPSDIVTTLWPWTISYKYWTNSKAVLLQLSAEGGLRLFSEISTRKWSYFQMEILWNMCSYSGLIRIQFKFPKISMFRISTWKIIWPWRKFWRQITVRMWLIIYFQNVGPVIKY